MTGCQEAIIAVGRDCDCGFPLIWMRGQQRCAVYGTHPAPADPVTFRNLRAPGAELIRLVSETPTDTQWTRNGKARRLRRIA